MQRCHYRHAKPVLVDEKERGKGNPAAGNLCIKSAWPARSALLHGDHDGVKDPGFVSIPVYNFTGDGALRDEQGNYRIYRPR